MTLLVYTVDIKVHAKFFLFKTAKTKGMNILYFRFTTPCISWPYSAYCLPDQLLHWYCLRNVSLFTELIIILTLI